MLTFISIPSTLIPSIDVFKNLENNYCPVDFLLLLFWDDELES